MTDPVQALVVRTAGTNCDGETVEALRRAGADVSLVHLHRLAGEPDRLGEARIVVLAGGFSYGDYVAAGRIFGLELRHSLAGALRAYVDAGGFLLGVCNGFQVLVETGLLMPDEPLEERSIALTGNASDRFECRWVTLESQESRCPWLVAGERWPVPVAHGEGRLVVRDEAALARLRERGQVALRYVDAGREHGPGEAGYPANPNGSVDDIAGICDPTGRVLGLMPHPERNVAPWHHPCWTRLAPREEGEGLPFYRRMIQAAASAAVGSSSARTSHST